MSPCGRTRRAGRSRGMRWARRALVACGLCTASALAAAAPEDFPDLPGDSGPQAAPTHPTGQGLRAALGWRAHYAYRTADASYPFVRRRPGWTSQRVSLRLEARTSMGPGLHAVAGARLSHEAARLDAPSGSEARAEEVFVDWQPAGRWRLKLGRQLVALGVSDYFQLQDAISPRDLRVMGAADLRESRLPVWATRVSHEGDRSATELILKHRFQANRHGPSGSDFDPAIRWGGVDRTVLAAGPRLSRHPDAALRWVASRPWGDVQAMLARVVDPAPALVGLQGERLVLGFQRGTVVGAGANHAAGSWLLKSEFSRRSAVRRARRAGPTGPGLVPLVPDTRPLSQWMVGARYTGFRGWMLDAELLTQRLHGHDASFIDPRTARAAVLNAQWTGWHDRLRLELMLAHWSGGSALLRAQASYDIDDAWQARLGVIDYRGGRPGSLLEPYRQQDRVTLGFERSL